MKQRKGRSRLLGKIIGKTIKQCPKVSEYDRQVPLLHFMIFNVLENHAFYPGSTINIGLGLQAKLIISIKNI